ncbi:MAG TPA: hypothetical protein VFY25_06835, partial [Anaerolineales bacterium]|nr:hypothetical protein [Anaerolineales bacterium]
MKRQFRRMILWLVLMAAITLSSCTSVATPMPQIANDPATPTPEVFNPLDPSPTPSDSILPLTCQVTDLNVYINEQWGYCFAYPMEFTVDESGAVNGIVSLYGPPLEDSADPIRISLEITAHPVPPQSDLAPLVDAFLTLFQGVPLPTPTTREPWLLGNELAEKLEPIPGLLSSRVVMALHNDLLFTLRFHPSDIRLAHPGLEDLTQTVTGSFGFLPRQEQPARQMKVISWLEFGQKVALAYDPALAPWVEARTVAAVPVSDQILFSESHPAFAQIRFVGFHGGRAYQLPVLPAENSVAQVMVFKTSEFPGFGDDHPQGFVKQLEALTTLFKTGVDPAFCSYPLRSETALPFLPWVNSKQSLCAQPEIIK